MEAKKMEIIDICHDDDRRTGFVIESHDNDEKVNLLFKGHIILSIAPKLDAAKTQLQALEKAIEIFKSKVNLPF